MCQTWGQWCPSPRHPLPSQGGWPPPSLQLPGSGAIEEEEEEEEKGEQVYNNNYNEDEGKDES